VITCGVCGSANEAEARFCGTCGSALAPAPADSGPAVVPGHGRATRELEPAEPDATPPAADETIQAPIAAEAAPASGPPSVVCTVCGTANDETRTFCRRCGNELRPAVTPLPPESPRPRPSRAPMVAILLVLAALATVAILVVLMVFGGGGAPSGTPSPSTAGPTSLPPTEPGIAPPTTTATEAPPATPTAEPTSLWKARCNRIFLRSGPDNGASPLPDDRVLLDQVVTVARVVEGGAYSVDFACTGGSVSATTWLEIIAIDGVAVSDSFGVDALYSASALFTELDGG